ncbi:mfs general substrate transporter [Lasallia pustulata]|uniref:Mfs general substrate transporter n=1 Tax=Lasallia pustulata TaxID=136370 RepID=A0A1W5CTM9_9LECA|nr:mfs general substrate transporter [Lasallia pustulata]
MPGSRGPPKLPVQQLVVLSICRFAEPVALSSVFPYLPEMIESFHVPKPEVAKWAGITSAVFALSQSLTGIAWGRASDRFGRKPVILTSMVCTMLASLCFGFSRNLGWAIASRSFAGASNGNVGIIRTTVAELVPQKELQPKAFSVMPLIWTIGSIFGPALGGALASPATAHPEWFGNNAFLKKYPYALPNMVISIFFLFGLTTGWLFLVESNETRKHRRDWGRSVGEFLVRAVKGFFSKKRRRPTWIREEDDEQGGSLLNHRHSSSTSTVKTSKSEDHVYTQSQPPTGYLEIFSRQTNINLVVYTFLALHSIACDQLLPIFMHNPPQTHRSANPDVHLPFKFAGGFGLDSSRIGLLFTFYGIAGMLIQFLAFPPLARRHGVLRCLKYCSLTFPLIYLILPFTALLPTPLTQQLGVFVIMLCKCWCSIFSFPCTTILLTNSAVSLRVLGTLNGVATSVSAIGRAAGPAIGGATFSWGVKRGYVILPWWTLALLAALGAVPVFWLVEMEGFGEGEAGDEEDGEEEEEEQVDDGRDDGECGFHAARGDRGGGEAAASASGRLVGHDFVPEC